MSSNYTKVAPSIKKSLISGTSFNQGSKPRTNLNDNYQFESSIFTSNIGSSNICYPFNYNFETNSYTDFDFGGTSNAMIPSGDFNVIKVDLSTKQTTKDTKLVIRYGHNNLIKDSTIRYSTIISPDTNFYRNYPIENEFFSLSLQNLDDTLDQRSLINGRVSLAKYTQYNAPVQVSDEIDRFTMGTLVRKGNDYDNDVVLDRITDVKKVERIGIMPSDGGSAEHIIWGEAGRYNSFAFSQDFRPLVLRSEGGDFLNDNNKIVVIEGIATGNVFVTEDVTLAASSNAFTVGEYKFVGNMFMKDKGLEGNYVICADKDTGIAYNIMEKSDRTTSMLYTVPDETDAIIKDVSVNGRTNLVNGSRFNLKRLNFTSNTSTTIYQNITTDSDINTTVPLNFKLNPGDCVVGEMIDGNGTSNIIRDGITSIVSRMNIYEFSNSTDKVI